MEARKKHLKTIQCLAKKRRTCIAAADLADLELGRELEEHCQRFSISSDVLAQELGLRQSTTAELRGLSQGKVTALGPDGTIPSISYSRIPEFSERYGSVSRVIGHAGSGLVLHESGLGLQPFYRNGKHSRRYISCDHMLMRFGDDAWVQIKGVQFGYGGAGPSHAYRALQLAGLSEEVSRVVFFRDGINLLIDEDGSIRERDFGEPPPVLPRLATDGSLVAVVHGSNWHESGVNRMRNWIDYLDQAGNSLPWKPGPRRISLYPSRLDAERDGFDSSPDGVPQLVIEQGDLQLWLIEFVEDDPSVWIPRQFRRYLEIVDKLPQIIVKSDDSPPFRRWLTSHAHRRPRVIELGEGKVTRVPKLGQV